MTGAPSRSVVVTGAAEGLGRSVAERLLAQGDAVVALDVNLDKLDEFASLAGPSAALSVVCGDVVVQEDLDRAALAAEDMAPLTAWVNNAGYNVMGSIHEIDRETYDRGFAVVFGGVFWGTATAVRHFLEADRKGSIVNMSSIQSMVALPEFPAYAAAKGAINALTRQVAGEYAGRGIRCNAVAPGLIATSLAEWTLERSADPEAQRAAWDVLCPIGRWGRPEDVSSAVRYLLDDESGFMTGHILVVDGGATVLARGC